MGSTCSPRAYLFEPVALSKTDRCREQQREQVHARPNRTACSKVPPAVRSPWRAVALRPS